MTERKNGTFSRLGGTLAAGHCHGTCVSRLRSRAHTQETLRVGTELCPVPFKAGHGTFSKTGHMVGQDMSALRAATSHPTQRSDRTDIAQSVLIIAKRVLENVANGRVYPQGTVEWAEQIVRGNTPPATSRAPAHAFPGVQA